MYSDIEFVHLTNEELYHMFYTATHTGSYAAYIRGSRCRDYASLFWEFSAAFQFPWYFGMNAAAFVDCMEDLEWLSFQNIFLVIDHFENLLKGIPVEQQWLCKTLLHIQRTWEEEGIKMRIVINRGTD